MPAPKYPPVEHPRVPVKRHPLGYWEAVCNHCSWTYEHSVGAAAREQADHHRYQHAAGRIEATR